MSAPVALIVGAGPGISGAFATALSGRGYAIALAARRPDRIDPFAAALNGRSYAVDVASPAAVSDLFSAVQRDLGVPDVVLFNAGLRLPGAITDLDTRAVELALQTNAMGAFAVAQAAARCMLPRGSGALFFTGATASVKGFPRSSAFAMGKFAVRGLAQCLAKELGPAGIHVAHFVIDGVVATGGGPADFSPENIAASYLAVLDQPPGAWSWEVELRSFRESF